jgi:hypothetical protein
MQEQIEADFKGVCPITKRALEKAFDVILERLGKPLFIHHYRILDNELYKYIPPGASLSSRDSYYEKALKTLLSHTSLPDLDFLICPMDGIPEAIVDPTFYLMEDPEDQVPLLGQAKLKQVPFVVLIPDQLSLSKDWFDTSQEIIALNGKVAWQDKIGKAFWRGGTSDCVGPLLKIKKETPRFLICRLSKERPELVDAAGSFIPELLEKAKEEKLPQLNRWALKEEHLRYKYLPVLDGNMCTYPGYQWRLLSDALTLKQESDQIQWFYGALRPYEHYLPIAHDMSDLVQKILWAEEHESDALKMIENARLFASENLLYEDGYRYFALVLERYAAKQKIDFFSLKKETKRDARWVNIQYRKRLEVAKILRRKIGKKAASPS